jgi:hypothetical protein
VNALADAAPGFIWRMSGEGENADFSVFESRDITVNMTVWESIEALAAFAYRNATHRTVMRRRTEWFIGMPAYLAMWWVPAGTIPTLHEGRAKLELIARIGPTRDAFDFKNLFPPPDSASFPPG